jgi:hypothetical protein
MNLSPAIRTLTTTRRRKKRSHRGVGVQQQTLPLPVNRLDEKVDLRANLLRRSVSRRSVFLCFSYALSLNGIKAASQKRKEDEAPSRNDPDQTLLDDEELAQESGIPPDDADAPATPPEPEPDIPARATRQAPRARPVSSRQTRASTRLRSVNPPELPSPTRRRAAVRAKATTVTPTLRRTRARTRSLSVDSVEGATRATAAKAKSKAKSKSGGARLDAVRESAKDEFVANSGDESDMQEVEVEVNLPEDGDGASSFLSGKAGCSC